MTETIGIEIQLECYPLTPDRWEDFEHLFGPRGAYGGCWCMWWRTTRSQFEKDQGDGNHKAMKNLVASGVVPGILAYHQGEAIGWCSVAPRDQYGSLNRSPVLKRLDNLPVWSIVCFYVAKNYRGKGVIRGLIQGAIAYVRKMGGRVLEAYPTDPQGKKMAPVSSFMGFPGLFKSEGFNTIARPSKSKVIMRYKIK